MSEVTKRPRVLVVEDEMTIALLIEDMLTDIGCEVAALATRLPQALEIAETVEADLAILDLNLDGRMSFPVAEVLARRGVPFVFATGYGEAGLSEAFRDRPLIKKPFDLKMLQAALRPLLEQAPPADPADARARLDPTLRRPR
jgi:CheY-like chemotaxis protein